MVDLLDLEGDLDEVQVRTYNPLVPGAVLAPLSEEGASQPDEVHKRMYTLSFFHPILAYTQKQLGAIPSLMIVVKLESASKRGQGVRLPVREWTLVLVLV